MFDCRFVEFGKAFQECKGSFDVVINCVSASLDFSGMMGMLSNDGVAVQVSLGSLCVCGDEAGSWEGRCWGNSIFTQVSHCVECDCNILHSMCVITGLSCIADCISYSGAAMQGVCACVWHEHSISYADSSLLPQHSVPEHALFCSCFAPCLLTFCCRCCDDLSLWMHGTCHVTL